MIGQLDEIDASLARDALDFFACSGVTQLPGNSHLATGRTRPVLEGSRFEALPGQQPMEACMEAFAMWGENEEKEDGQSCLQLSSCRGLAMACDLERQHSELLIYQSVSGKIVNSI